MSCKIDHSALEEGTFCPDCGIQVIRKRASHLPIIEEQESTENEEHLASKIHEDAKNLATTARGLMVTFYVLAGLSIVVGLFLSFYSVSTDSSSTDIFGLSSTNTSTSHPFVFFGIILALSGVLEALIFGVVFRYIELKARFTQFQISKEIF